jgi:thiamine biosynthesis protein ThiS
MKITVNYKEIELPGYDCINITDLLIEIGYTSTVIMVKVNGHLVKKADQGDYLIHPGDDVIAIPIVGGG